MIRLKKISFELLRLTAFVIAFLTILQILSIVFVPKSSQGQKGEYKRITKSFCAESKNTVDVFFVGNSNIYRAISPMSLWQQGGVAASVSGKPMQKPNGAYSILKELYKNQTPKVVVIETDMLFVNYSENFSKNKASARIKNVRNAIKMMAADFDESVVSGLGYYFPIFKYHNRWQEIVKHDFTDYAGSYRSAYKGFISDYTVKPYVGGFDYMNISSKRTVNFSAKSEKLLDKMIALCEKNGTKVVLVSVPSASSWNMQKHNTVKEYADKKGIDFIDYNIQGSVDGFDWKTDTKDGGEHLNSWGAEKVSLTFSQYLKANCNLTDHSNDNLYISWKKAADEYKNEFSQNKQA